MNHDPFLSLAERWDDEMRRACDLTIDRDATVERVVSLEEAMAATPPTSAAAVVAGLRNVLEGRENGLIRPAFEIAMVRAAIEWIEAKGPFV